MRCSLLLALALSLYPCGGLLAIDLAKIDRSPVKLPELNSRAVQYGLLAFGPDAAKRVLLVHDGDRLYVDRNGNGDLTEPGETVMTDESTGKASDGVYRFVAGDLPDASGHHKALIVGWSKIDHMQDSPQIDARLEREPGFRGCWMSLDVDMPGFRGQGIDGRVTQSTFFFDCQGLLEFAPRVEDAPIIHFGGPWEVTFFNRESWRTGRKQESILAVGTRGLGPGTTAYVAYENVIPARLKPVLDVTYPAAAGATPLTARYELTRRCCGVNLLGDVAVPAEVPPGVATVSVSLPGWPGTTIAATKHEVEILPALPGLKREPVSSRLAGKLQHQHGDGSIVAIQFSPDGRRLLAGDYPGGLVHVWEIASGRRLATFDMGEGLRGSHKYFVVTPDWKTILSPSNEHGTAKRVERDGKSLYRISYDGSIRVWDLESGSLRQTWKTNPARSTRGIALWPVNKQVLAYEDTPCEFESQRARAVSLWDLNTGEHKQLFAGYEHIEGFSSDGKQVVVSMPRKDNHVFDESLVFYDVASWKPVATIPLKEMQSGYQVDFLEGVPMAMGLVSTNLKPDDFQNQRVELKFWNLPNGDENWSLELKAGETVIDMQQTPERSAVIVATRAQRQNGGRWLRVDLATHDVQVMFDEPNLWALPPMFHPGGKWMIVPAQELSKAALRSDLDADELPQPHFEVRDIATGALLEVIVSPPSNPISAAFSPDGNTLATSGNGEVLLWDFHDPPGNSPPAVVGQPFEAAGTLVGGKPLDWAAYRGKVVLVTYWATWCQPCVAEIPEIKKLHGALHARGFDVLGVSLDKDQAVLERFLETQPVPWPVVCAGTSEASGREHPLVRKYGIESIPKSFLLDRQGKIAAIDMHGAELSKLAEELLKGEAEKKAAK